MAMQNVQSHPNSPQTDPTPVVEVGRGSSGAAPCSTADNSFTSVLWRRMSTDMRLHDGWTLEDCERNFRKIVGQTLADSPPNPEAHGRSGSDVPCISLLAALKAVDDEPEYPGQMPPEMKTRIQVAVDTRDFDLLVEIMRLTVRLTKQGIRKRIEDAANAPAVARAVASRPECGCSPIGGKP